MCSVWTYFFTYGNDLPSGVGFCFFGIRHFTWLFVMAFFSVIFWRMYLRWERKKQLFADLLLGCLLVVLILLRTLYLIVVHSMSMYELPLHLCSIAGVLCMIHSFLKQKGIHAEKEWLGQVLYAVCLPGAVCALLFPDWNYYPAIHFITVEGFVFHIGIVMYVVAQLLTGGIRPRFRYIRQVLVFLVGITVPIYVLDKKLYANYLFVNWPSPGSPLEWIFHLTGEKFYLCGYALAILLAVICMYLGYMAVSKLFFYFVRRKRRITSTKL